MALFIYVDDIFIVENDKNVINKVKSFLNVAFKIKGLGNLKFFLGLEVARTKKGIHICQRKYTLEILEDASMLNVKPATTPMVKKNENLFEQNSSVHEITTYRRII